MPNDRIRSLIWRCSAAELILLNAAVIVMIGRFRVIECAMARWCAWQACQVFGGFGPLALLGNKLLL